MANEIIKKETQIVESVISRVENLKELGQIHLPKNYSPQNAVRAAFLVLKEKGDDLAKVTTESIQSAMFKMVVSGLSVAKKQGDFIRYGNKMVFSPEYHGNKAMVKRMCDVIEVTHNTVYKKDEFEYTSDKNGRKQIVKHVQKIENLVADQIIGAYATATFSDETTQSEVMSFDQIKRSWMMGATKGNSPAHRNFPDRMAEKTVANRLMTSLINASDDGSLFDKDNEEQPRKEFVPEKKQKVEFEEINDDEPSNENETEENQEPEPTPTPEKTPDPKKKETKNKEEKQSQSQMFEEDDQPF